MCFDLFYAHYRVARIVCCWRTPMQFKHNCHRHASTLQITGKDGNQSSNKITTYTLFEDNNMYCIVCVNACEALNEFRLLRFRVGCDLSFSGPLLFLLYGALYWLWSFACMLSMLVFVQHFSSASEPIAVLVLALVISNV